MGHQWDPKTMKYRYIIRCTSVRLQDSDEEEDEAQEEEEEDMNTMEEDTQVPQGNNAYVLALL